MSVEFWLIGSDEKLQLPVNPEANTYESPFTYEDYEVEGLGEVTSIKKKALDEHPIESFFPAVYDRSYCEYDGFPTPTECLALIKRLRNKRQPIRYIVTGSEPINTLVTIRDISVIADKYGAPGDIYYTLTLKEYREIEIKTIDTSKTQNKPNTNSSTSGKRPSSLVSKKVTSYVVKKNDCLFTIAKKKEIYGNANKWRTIYNANKKLIGSNPNKIKPGMKLVIPR